MNKFENDIVIDRPVSEVFDYITRPYYWFEWFTTCIQVDISKAPNQKGERFDMFTVQQPFSWLPMTVKKVLHYEVLDCEGNKRWRITGRSASIDVEVEYVLVDLVGATHFKRIFSYRAKGINKILIPLLLKKKIMKDAFVSVNNLKQQLEKNKTIK